MTKNMILQPGYGCGGILHRTIDAQLEKSSRSMGRNIVGTSEDERWMHAALLAAMEQVGVPAPNPSVGCVIVKDGMLVAQGGTERYGGLHAERKALMQITATDGAKGATAYVTLEPCNHHGKQPPCVQALIAAGIKRCVVAAKDSHHLVSGQGIAALRDAGILVDVGILRNECIAYNYPFFAAQTLKRPVFIGKWAQTVDGHLADDQQCSAWISTAVSRSYTHWLRQKYDAIMVGAGTLLHDVPTLTVRSCATPINRQPLKIIFDPHGRLATAPHEALQQVMCTSLAADQGKAIYAAGASVFAQKAPAQWPSLLAKSDHILPLYLDEQTVLEDFVEQLHSECVTRFYGQQLQSVLVEGGPRLLNLMIEKDLIDCFHTFIAPAFMGATSNHIGCSVAPNRAERTIATMARYHLLAVAQLDNDVLMEYLPQDRCARIFGDF